MANSPRTAAPCSACTAAFTGPAHSPTLPAGRALMALADIRDAIGNASHALAALCELLTLANGAQISADHLHVLLSPVQASLEKAACDLNDLPLIELGTENYITDAVLEGRAA